MSEALKENSEIQNSIGEIINVWKKVTGDTHEYSDIKRGEYLKTSLWVEGQETKIEFYPDILNGNNKLVISEAPQFEDWYQEGGITENVEEELREIAKVISRLKANGLNFSIETPQDMHDGGKLVDMATERVIQEVGSYESDQ